jgi:UDP-glucose 4-epimerase
MKILVTGGAGFIGSHLCEFLTRPSNEVVVLDNLSSGSMENISNLMKERSFTVVRGDCKSPRDVSKAVRGADVVYHFAANPEVRLDRAMPQDSFDENILATKVMLDAVVEARVPNLVYASSSTVYGDATTRPTPEDYSPMLPVSIYGATKLASESLIVAYAKTYRFSAQILRLANVIGPKSRHGVVFDFVAKLRENPRSLQILGDGTQSKSYLFIQDCIDAIDLILSRAEGTSIYNVGSSDQLSVLRVADLVCEEMGVDPSREVSGGVDGGRGWVGDVKQMLLDVTKLKSIGWAPRFSSEEAVRSTLRHILK